MIRLSESNDVPEKKAEAEAELEKLDPAEFALVITLMDSLCGGNTTRWRVEGDQLVLIEVQ